MILVMICHSCNWWNGCCIGSLATCTSSLALQSHKLWVSWQMLNATFMYKWPLFCTISCKGNLPVRLCFAVPARLCFAVPARLCSAVSAPYPAIHSSHSLSLAPLCSTTPPSLAWCHFHSLAYSGTSQVHHTYIMGASQVHHAYITGTSRIHHGYITGTSHIHHTYSISSWLVAQ